MKKFITTVILISNATASVDKWAACKEDSNCKEDLVCCSISFESETSQLCSSTTDTQVPFDNPVYGGWNVKCTIPSPPPPPASTDFS